MRTHTRSSNGTTVKLITTKAKPAHCGPTKRLFSGHISSLIRHQTIRLASLNERNQLCPFLFRLFMQSFCAQKSIKININLIQRQNWSNEKRQFWLTDKWTKHRSKRDRNAHSQLKNFIMQLNDVSVQICLFRNDLLSLTPRHERQDTLTRGSKSRRVCVREEKLEIDAERVVRAAAWAIAQGKRAKERSSKQNSQSVKVNVVRTNLSPKQRRRRSNISGKRRRRRRRNGGQKKRLHYLFGFSGLFRTGCKRTKHAHKRSLKESQTNLNGFCCLWSFWLNETARQGRMISTWA